MPFDDAVRLCTAATDERDRHVARRFVEGVFEAQNSRRSRRCCVRLGHLGRNTCAAGCDRALPSALDCHRNAMWKAASTASTGAMESIQRALNFVRDADVRREWNKSRGLPTRIQQSDFAEPNMAWRSVTAAIDVMRRNGVVDGDAVSALRDLFRVLGRADDDASCEVIDLLGITWAELRWFAERAYDDACDVAAVGDVPSADRLARRLCSDREIDDPGAVDAVRSLVGPAWLLMSHVLGFMADGERPFWDRFERAYSASRIEVLKSLDASDPGPGRHA